MIKTNKRLGLSAQLNIIFTLITLISSILFIVIFERTIKDFSKNLETEHFITYQENLMIDFNNNVTNYIKNENYSFVYFKMNDEFQIIEILENNYREFYDELLSEKIIGNFFSTSENKQKAIIEYEKLRYILEFNYDNSSNNYIALLIVSDGTYAKTLRNPVTSILSIGFICIIILGNATILLWSSSMVRRIKILKMEVSQLRLNDYKTKIKFEGNDEISELSNAIESMREEIRSNEEVKESMLQNISHDLKTPITVIRSYAEAIKDGVSDVNELDVIIKQTNILERKVFQLLEWTKLEYIKEKENLKDINIKEIIELIADLHKYDNSDIEFILNLDDSTLPGLYDYYFSMINNIVENALRYAKSVIKITLKNHVIAIFNDGQPIDERFINDIIKPYEKGHKGQFGLGMTIIKRTVKMFNLKLSIQNHKNGVSFLIEKDEDI